MSSVVPLRGSLPAIEGVAPNRDDVVDPARVGELRAVAWRDFAALSKPRIVLMELVVVVCSALMAGADFSGPGFAVCLLLGTGLVAASAAAGNQVLEARTDALMPRTRKRPIAAGRLSAWQGSWFAGICLALGIVLLWRGINGQVALLGLLSWLLYVLVYTGLKYHSPFNTWVGAVVGAGPVLMGWGSSGSLTGIAPWALACTLFLWQFPHFMAIAWLYRDDYVASGAKMLTVVEPTGRRAGALALSTALLLLPVSVLPLVLWMQGGIYFWLILSLGGYQTWMAAKFLVARNRQTARGLLRASLVYLPSVLLLLTLASLH